MVTKHLLPPRNAGWMDRGRKGGQESEAELGLKESGAQSDPEPYQLNGQNGDVPVTGPNGPRDAPGGNETSERAFRSIGLDPWRVACGRRVGARGTPRLQWSVGGWKLYARQHQVACAFLSCKKLASRGRTASRLLQETGKDSTQS